MCRALCVLVIALFRLTRSWDIAVTAGNRLEFYTDDGTLTETVYLAFQNVTSIVYNENNKMLLYIDKQSDNDAICGYSMNSMYYKCYVGRNGRNIQGLAYDPVTEKLFYTDTKERSINWYSFKPGSTNSAHGNLLIKMDDGFPTDITVDSCRGNIYWINRYLTTSTIERARLDGSEREVIINPHNLNLHSLAIDQQAQKIYWKMPTPDLTGYVYSADLNGKNREPLIMFDYINTDVDIVAFDRPNSLSVSKESLLSWSRCSICGPRSIIKYFKPLGTYDFQTIFKVDTESVVGIAANYKIKDQIQGILHCNHVVINYEINDTVKIAKEYNKGSFCVHGTKVHGQNLCKCTPGYTGERCEVSVCENYCFQGKCSFNEKGLPECRCNAGYSGERCEVNICHGFCSNNGTCSLNEKSAPVCQCKGEYVGHRCEMSVCENYCFQGKCSSNEEGLPECRCNAGYTGERCEVNACHGYCSNNGTCSLNEKSEPVCQCKGEYVDQRCEISACEHYCIQGKCNFNAEGLPECRCNAGYTGERCEVSACHGYCTNNGTCSLNEQSEPVCQCKGEYVGHRCEISACENYCFQGNCSLNEEGVPECGCYVGYTGDRCEVNACHGFCLNSGTCFLNEEDEPGCECVGEYTGERCEVAVSLNNGDSSVTEQHEPSCQFVLDRKLITIRLSSQPLGTTQQKET